MASPEKLIPCPDLKIAEEGFFPPFVCRKGYALTRKVNRGFIYKAPHNCLLIKNGVARNCMVPLKQSEENSNKA